MTIANSYPQWGAVARNKWRDEFILIERGTCEVTVNGVTSSLRAGARWLAGWD